MQPTLLPPARRPVPARFTAVSLALACLLMTSCASTRSPASDNQAAPDAPASVPAQPGLNAMGLPTAPIDSGDSTVLRIVADPPDVQMWLLSRSVDGTYRAFLKDGAAVGTDSLIPDSQMMDPAVLYVQAPGHVPVAIEFVANFVADLFPRLRKVPAPGVERPPNDEEALAAEVWRELSAQFAGKPVPF